MIYHDMSWLIMINNQILSRKPKITMLNHQISSKMFHFNMVTFGDMSWLIMTLKNPKREAWFTFILSSHTVRQKFSFHAQQIFNGSMTYLNRFVSYHKNPWHAMINDMVLAWKNRQMYWTLNIFISFDDFNFMPWSPKLFLVSWTKCSADRSVLCQTFWFPAGHFAT